MPDKDIPTFVPGKAKEIQDREARWVKEREEEERQHAKKVAGESVGTLVSGPSRDHQAMVQNLLAFTSNKTDTLFSVVHGQDNHVIFIENRNAYSKGKQYLDNYIKSYKNLHSMLGASKPLTVMIQTADGKFLDEKRNPIAAPLNFKLPSYSFNIAEQAEAVSLEMHIPHMLADFQAMETNRGLNNIHLYAFQLREDLKLKQKPAIEVTGNGASKAQEHYNNEKRSIERAEANTTFLAAFFLIMGIVVIGLTVAMLFIFPPANLLIAVLLFASTAIPGALFSGVGAYTLSQDSLYFTTKDKKEETLCILCHNYFSGGLVSKTDLTPENRITTAPPQFFPTHTTPVADAHAAIIESEKEAALMQQKSLASTAPLKAKL